MELLGYMALAPKDFTAENWRKGQKNQSFMCLDLITSQVMVPSEKCIPQFIIPTIKYGGSSVAVYIKGIINEEGYRNIL